MKDDGNAATSASREMPTKGMRAPSNASSPLVLTSVEKTITSVASYFQISVFQLLLSCFLSETEQKRKADSRMRFPAVVAFARLICLHPVVRVAHRT